MGTPLILDFVMNCRHMCSQGSALAKYFVTVLTYVVLDFVMNCLYVHSQGTALAALKLYELPLCA